MSLIHWWPLNGNITDNGVDNFTLSATPSFSTTGKIGKCATNTNINAGLTYLSNQTLPLAKDSPISIFTWVYMNDYSTTGANLNGLVSNHNHGHNGDKGSGFGLNLRNNGNSFQVSISTSSTSGRTFSTYCGNTTFSAGEWHHVGFTYNGSRINFYLDGNYDGGLNFTSSYNSNNPIGIFCWSTGYPEYSSSCQLNDVRIYNHALSTKEVKEISKGLVLHYNFEDEYIEPTTNLIDDGNTFSSWSSYGFGSHGSKTILDGATPNGINKFCRVTDNYTNTSNAAIEMARWVTSTALTNGEQVAFSAYVRGVNNTVGKNCFIHIYNSNGTDTISTTIKSITLTANWQRIEGVFTWNKTNTSSTSFSCYVVCEMMQGEQFDFCEPQFEAKDHNTAYVNGTRSVGKVYDNSGYGNNGTVAGNCQIKSDTAVGKHSIYSPAGANYVERQNFPVGGFNADQQFTINAWIKIVGYVGSDWNTIFRLAATNARDQQLHFCYNASGNIILSQFSDDPQFTTNVALNTWAMVTWVHYKDGSTAKCKYFVNGQQVGSTQSYSGLLNIQNNARLTLFYDSIRNSYGANLHMGDFKIYSTALSAEDILAEYNRKAAIDKNGNLFTGEIVETTYNLLTSENLLNGRVNTSATSNVGEIVTRNSYSAYRVSPVAYWSGDEATSKNICKGQFGSGQYIFDLWIDVDEVYYSGNGQWVPGGFNIYYTDGSVDNVVVDANSTQGHSGYQHLIRKTNANKTISGLGVYYYIGVPIYIRCDSVICKVNSDGKICKNNIIAGGQFVEPAVSDSKCKLTRYGVISNAIKEL